MTAFLDSHADRPMILYLAAPIVGGHDVPLTRGALESEVEVWKGVISFDAHDDVSLQKLLEACENRKKKAKLLLIIDPGQVGTDTVLGLFGDSVARELRRLGTPPPENSVDREPGTSAGVTSVFSAHVRRSNSAGRSKAWGIACSTTL